MKKLFTLALSSLTFISTSFGQCSEDVKTSVLLAGDSWAAFMYGDQTINQGLRNIGHSDKRFTSSVIISENGADTYDFYEPGEKQTNIQSLVDANPDIQIIHMSIGGNDLLGDWNVSFTQEETNALAEEVEGRLYDIFDFLKSTREGMNVFWPGYTYPNFEEVIDESGAGSLHPFFDTWDGMGQPDNLTINTILNDMSDSVANYAATDPQVDFVRAQGVLQHYYGQNDALLVEPFGTYAAGEPPLPLGYPEYPSPSETMRFYLGIFVDCFHLSPDAYLTFFQYQAERYYQKALMDEFYTLSIGDSSEGSISVAGAITEEIKFGNDNGDEVSAVLTFNTAGIADTIITNAGIFLKRKSLTGEDPTEGSLLVKIIGDKFGSTIELETGDISEAGDASGTPCVFGSSEEDGHWVRIDLPSDVVAQLGENDQVQIMISAPGSDIGVMEFFGAEDEVFAPVLNVNYQSEGPEPEGINDNLITTNLPVYPNPTNGDVTIGIDTKEIESIEVMDLSGALVMQPASITNRIDISSLTAGTYILRVNSDYGVSTTRIIKR